jgi:colanic acid/amylovoran biosynthesis glycosyltransferase
MRGRHQPEGGPGTLKVAHLVDCFLARSEVFIYELVRNQTGVEKLVIARQVRNRELFPFEPLFHTDGGGNGNGSGEGRGMVRRVVNRLSRGGRNDLLAALARLREEGPHVLHAHFGLLGVRALELRRRLGVPLVTSFYGVDASKQAREPGNRRGLGRLFREGDLFLAEGSAMKMRLAGIGCPPDRIRIQHLGVDPDRIGYIRRTFPLPGEAVRVLFCGRFVEKKGLPDALFAVKIARDAGVDVRFRIVGDGPLRREVEQLVEARGLGPHVEFLGMLDHAAYLRELASAHLLLQPSRTASDGDTEGGAPTVLLEAQASGLPVVSTTHADIPEYVRDGESGLLVEEGDVRDLARALLSIAGRPARLETMGLRGRQHVLERYHVRLEAEKLERIYREVLS